MGSTDSVGIVGCEAGDRLFADMPGGQPGERAPHMLLERNGEQFCTCYLFGEHFVLLTGAGGLGWREAALRAANRLGVELVVRCIGGELADVDGRWPAAYGVGYQGAVLIRPDGLVGWRTETCVARPEQTLAAVLAEQRCS